MTTRKEDDGVHRLVDMVVEEVSLVDRAANKHRFLIVKRDDVMDETKTNTAAAAETTTTKEDEAIDSSLGTAIAALENLADVVELLASGNATDPRLASLSEQLSMMTTELLAQIGVGTEESETVEARAPAPGAASAPNPPSTSNPTGALTPPARLAAVMARLKAKAPKPPAKATDETCQSTAKGLSALVESVRAMTETLKEQQLRIGKLEKHFGLPNSAASAEEVTKAAPKEIGWPLDLNRPLDRESVDKTVSFHNRGEHS